MGASVTACDALLGDSQDGGEWVVANTDRGRSPGPAGGLQIRSPTSLATWLRITSVTCWYRAAMDSLDQPSSDMTVRAGWRRTSRTVAAVTIVCVTRQGGRRFRRM